MAMRGIQENGVACYVVSKMAGHDVSCMTITVKRLASGIPADVILVPNDVATK